MVDQRFVSAETALQKQEMVQAGLKEDLALTKTQILSAHFEDDLPSVPAFTCYSIALISSLSKLVRMISYVYERTKVSRGREYKFDRGVANSDENHH